MSVIEKRFFQHIVAGDNGCIHWTGAKNGKGYGLFYHDGRQRRATHASWFIAHGVWPEDQVLHTCDNPGCVAPDHLMLGSNRDNVDDMLTKGRQLKGEDKPSAKLTEDVVLEIRRRGAAGTHTFAQMAAEFGVKADTIARAMHGETWSHLPGATPNNYASVRVHPKRDVVPRSSQPRFEVRGERLTIGEIAKKYGFLRNTIVRRVDIGLRGEHLIRPVHMAPRQQYTRR